MSEPYTDKELRRIQREDQRSPTTLRFLATIARLQVALTEAERKWNLTVGDRDACLGELAKAERERDGYKALAKRFATSLHYKDIHELPFKDCPYRICQEARAAIDALPEEAREKERR